MEARVNFIVKFRLKEGMEKQDMYRSRVLLRGYRVKKKLGEGTRPICYIAIVENGRLLRTTIQSVNKLLVLNNGTANCGAKVNEYRMCRARLQGFGFGWFWSSLLDP